MPLPARKHFPLDEIAEAWGTTARVLLLKHGAEDQLQICVLLFGAVGETYVDIEDGIPSTFAGRAPLWGAKPLFAEDLWRLHGHGTVRVERLKSNEADRSYILDQPLDITLHELVITAAERKRLEAEYDLVSAPPPDQLFEHSAEYRTITIGGRQFILSPKRASIVRVLHAAWLAGAPWMAADAVLQAAGSESSRMVDVFGPVAGWRTIFRSDNAGNWRINLPDPLEDGPARRAFRRPWLRLVR